MSQPTYGYTSGIPYVLPGQRFEGTNYTPTLAAAIAARVGQLQDIEVLPDGRLRFTLPNGDQITTDDSARGPAGEDGADGPPNTLTVGTVQTGPLAASITGTAPNQTLNLTIPAGTLQPGDVPRLPIDMAGGNVSTGSSSTAPGVYINAQPTGLPDDVASIRGTFIKLSAVAALFFSEEGEVLSWGYDDAEGGTAWTTLGTDPALAADLAALTARVSTAESDIDALEGRATSVEGTVAGHGSRLTTAETNITALQAVPPQLVGTGQPNGRVTAIPGAFYVDTARTAGASVWVKTSGTGNTGWEVTKGVTGVVTITEWDASGTVTKGTAPTGLTPRAATGFIGFARDGDAASLIIRSADITGTVTIPTPAWARPVTNARTILAHNDGTAGVSIATNALVLPTGLTRAINPFSAVATWPLFGTPWPTSL